MARIQNPDDSASGWPAGPWCEIVNCENEPIPPPPCATLANVYDTFYFRVANGNEFYEGKGEGLTGCNTFFPVVGKLEVYLCGTGPNGSCSVGVDGPDLKYNFHAFANIPKDTAWAGGPQGTVLCLLAAADFDGPPNNFSHELDCH